MSPQLSIYWQGPEHLSWLWHGDDQQYDGRWDELVDQKQARNLDQVSVRVYLPHDWFTSLTVKVPGGARRVPEQVLRFAAEEQLAQDIDTLHIVPLAKAEKGELPVLVIERERLSQVKSTLAEAGMQIDQAFDAGWFLLDKPVTSDVNMDVDAERILVRFGWTLHQVHPNGFSQWFELWKSTEGLDETPVSIRMTSRDSTDQGRQLRTELEAAGDTLDWVVTPATGLADWDEQCRENRAAGNLMVGAFTQRKSSGNTGLWVPITTAAVFALAIWSGLTATEAMRDEQRASDTWAASEDVFRQVFGPNKRIQRPLMVREIDNRIVSMSSDESSGGHTVLQSLEALTRIDETLLVEDFRYQQNRGQMLFTLKQPEGADGDAFARFERVKSQLESSGYQVEYSASQDRDAVRGKYQATAEGAS